VPFLLAMRLGGSQSQSEHCEERKVPCPCPTLSWTNRSSDTPVGVKIGYGLDGPGSFFFSFPGLGRGGGLKRQERTSVYSPASISQVNRIGDILPLLLMSSWYDV
jgi:hypothetical protein